MKVVRSLDRLKDDLSKMLVRQEPDVIFTERSNANDPGAVEIFDGGDKANANIGKGGGSGGGGVRRGEGSASASASSSGGGGGKTVGAHLAILR